MTFNLTYIRIFFPKRSSQIQRIDWWLPEVRCVGLAKWVKVSKGTDFQLQIIPVNIEFSIVTIVNNTLLYIQKLLREQIFQSFKKKTIAVFEMDINLTYCDNFTIHTNILHPYVVGLKLFRINKFVTCQLYLSFF